MNEKMKRAGIKNGLKKHRVGRKLTSIYGPVDIEGHRGNDGRMYVLDFARTFPPEYFNAETWERSCNLYRQLRPELVRAFGRPLSSDALSAFGKHQHKEHDLEVKEATRYLTEQVHQGVV